MALTDLWAFLPEAADRPAPGDNSRWGPLHLEAATQVQDGVWLSALQLWTHNWPNDQLHAWTDSSNDGDALRVNAEVVTALVGRYPEALRPITENLQVPMETSWFGTRGSVRLTVPLGRQPGDVLDQLLFYRTTGTEYRGQRYWFPAVAGQTLHPLVAWWAVLYTFSMLARYEPERWAKTIDVNQSEWAMPVEHLLDCALDALPDVIYAALSTTPVVGHDHWLPGQPEAPTDPPTRRHAT